MSTLIATPSTQVSEHSPPSPVPDHVQLPGSDGLPVGSFQEHLLSTLLMSSIWPLLLARHPDGQFAIGLNSDVYFKHTDPPLQGNRAPNWFYLPGVSPMPGDPYLRSYVLWRELLHPYLLIEFVSGDGSEACDRTAWTGKFWIYEHLIIPAHYINFDAARKQLDVYRHEAGRFRRMSPGSLGHYLIEDLGVELGIWEGTYNGMALPWLRFYDLDGSLILSAEERAEIAKRRALQEIEHGDPEK